MPDSTHISIDLGAESGRVMLATVSDRGIDLKEIHRWPSRRVKMLGGERWDVLFMWGEILDGLKLAADEAAHRVMSVSVDSWGVDYVLLYGGHPHLTPPFMYRDPRTDQPYERVTTDAALRRQVFAETGIQFMPLNTIYQLMADGNELLSMADGLLLIADYFHYLLCGNQKQERSMASTTQLYNPNTRQWSDALLEKLDLPKGVLPELTDAGQTIGTVLPEVAERTGLGRLTKVVATCSHDTGNAVAATPIAEGAAYLSSGTWSLLGVELPTPVINEAAEKHNFTNEIGFGHSVRLLKNISGLFMVQELRGEFIAGKLSSYQGDEQDFDYATLADLAREAKPLRSLIRPELPQFARPGQMIKKIADYCRETSQPVPQTPGQFVRCVYESLALLYAETLGQIEQITGSRPTSLNIVGGGSRAEVLNQLAADACGIPVEAGPNEATALGNVGIQAIANETIAGLAELRALVRRSFPVKRFTPRDNRYIEAADRFAQLRS